MVNPSADQALVLSTRDNWLVLQEEAKMALRSGFLPQHIKTPEQAIAIAMVGRELGISPWRALTGIKVIQGTPTLSSELMAHLIYRAHGGDALTVEETTPDRCTISYQRRGAKDRKSYTYTMAMAERAGLASNPNYKKHPENMLRARCISNIARMAFPDTIAGCYTEDEIGGMEDTTPHQTTTVIDAAPEQPRQLHAAPATPSRADQQTKLAKTLADKSPPSPPATPEQRTKIALLERINTAWWGTLRNVPEIISERDATAWIGQLNQMRKAPIVNGAVPVSEDQYTLLTELGSDLVALGETVERSPEDLTVTSSYELFKILASQKAKAEEKAAKAVPAQLVVDPTYDPADDGLPF